MKSKNTSKQNFIEMKNFPLNSILYGPPSTGKTYNSIDKAVTIATGSSSAIYITKNSLMNYENKDKLNL